MATVSVHEAKTHLSRLIGQVLAGGDVVISRNKEPVVRQVREVPLKKKPLLGALEGQFKVRSRRWFLRPALRRRTRSLARRQDSNEKMFDGFGVELIW